METNQTINKDTTYPFAFDATEAKAKSDESEATFERLLKTCFDRIEEAADKGENKTLFPGSGFKSAHEERAKAFLRLQGYTITSFSSTVGNTAIHWGNL